MHRVGRTGRAGQAGTAVTLLAPADAALEAELRQELGSPAHEGGAQDGPARSDDAGAHPQACSVP